MPSFWLVKSEPDCFSIHDLAAAPGGDLLGWGAELSGPEPHAGHANRRSGAVLSFQPPIRRQWWAWRGWRPGPIRTRRRGTSGPITVIPRPRRRIRFGDWSICASSERSPSRCRSIGCAGEPALAKMELLRKGSRLSVQPVTAAEFEKVLELAGACTAKGTKNTKKRGSKTARGASLAASQGGRPRKAVAAKPANKKSRSR